MGSICPHKRSRGVRLTLDVQALGEARFNHGLAIVEVARAAKVGHSTAFRAFRSGIVSLRTARKIARALGLSLEGLWLDARTGQPWRPPCGGGQP